MISCWYLWTKRLWLCGRWHTRCTPLIANRYWRSTWWWRWCYWWWLYMTSRKWSWSSINRWLIGCCWWLWWLWWSKTSWLYWTMRWWRRRTTKWYWWWWLLWTWSHMNCRTWCCRRRHWWSWSSRILWWHWWTWKWYTTTHMRRTWMYETCWLSSWWRILSIAYISGKHSRGTCTTYSRIKCQFQIYITRFFTTLA